MLQQPRLTISCRGSAHLTSSLLSGIFKDYVPRVMLKRQEKRCKVEACRSLVRSLNAILCDKHYRRLLRTGTTDKRKPRKCKTSHGYVQVYDSDNQRMEYEHRKVLFESMGSGPFKCYWCNRVVTKKTMHVDHLNEVRDDNDSGNVVPSCAICNQARGRHKMISTMQSRGMNLTLHGEALPISEWAKRLGISRVSLRWRLRNWSVERALTMPRGNTGP